MYDSKSNDLGNSIIAQVIEEMKAEQGEYFSLEKINLSELERRTGISRARLRRLKTNGFVEVPHGRTGQKAKFSILRGYTSVIDNLLKQGIANSVVCFERVKHEGYKGSLTTVKEYIAKHKDLVPAKRQIVEPQGSRGTRYYSSPGEMYQMDWGFVKVYTPDGNVTQAACFAMICHHCGKRYVEFFPNAKQENLFIGMLHGFSQMGIPKQVLTDNMRSVVIRRDFEGNPIWQKDYEDFMHTVGFSTRLCKPRHPYTKGKVERLVRYVKSNFLAGRTFYNLSDLNAAALEWCELQDSKFQNNIGNVPNTVHASKCINVVKKLDENIPILSYLSPERRISFDGFVTYEGRRFGVPFKYAGKVVRVCRKKNSILIYTPDFKTLLVSHDVTWSRKDRYCIDQYKILESPEEYPTMPVKTSIQMITDTETSGVGFDKFNFGWEDYDNE